MRNQGGLLDEFRNAFSKPNNATVQLILINAVVFLVFDGLFGVTLRLFDLAEYYYAVQEWFMLPNSTLDPTPGTRTGPYLLRQPWSFITNIFMHGGIGHIFWNMLFLYFFGRIVQEYLGSQKVINLFVLGGLVGAEFIAHGALDDVPATCEGLYW